MQKNRTAAVTALLTATIAIPAFAGLVTVDPNNYYNGQVITTADVKLATETVRQVGTDPNGNPLFAPKTFGPVYSVDISGACAASVMCSPVGSKVFAPAPTGSLPNTPNFGAGGFWGGLAANPAFDCVRHCLLNSEATGSVLLRVDFSKPTDFVDALGFFNGGDPSIITALDAAGNLIGECDGSGNPCFSLVTPIPNHGFGWGTISISSTTDDIKTVLIGGDNSYRGIGEIQFDNTKGGSVPAPDEIWLGLSGVLIVVLFHLRRTAPLLLARRKRGP
jgi:hypothetical protein